MCVWISLTVNDRCGFAFFSDCPQVLFSFYICGLKLYLILSDVVIAFSDYKEKIEFTGQLLIEPKPKEPTKHQYDYGMCGKIWTKPSYSHIRGSKTVQATEYWKQQQSPPMYEVCPKSNLRILVEGKHWLASWLVCLSPNQVVQDWGLARAIVLCSWAGHFHTVHTLRWTWE